MSWRISDSVSGAPIGGDDAMDRAGDSASCAGPRDASRRAASRP